MTPIKRFVIGGIGALMPLLITFLSIDYEMLFESANISTGTIVGFIIRYIVLFLIGGFIAYLHTDETKPFKLFEIGIAAPALVTSMITVNGLSSNIQPSSPPAPHRASFSIITKAYAEEIGVQKEVQKDEKIYVAGFFRDLANSLTGGVYQKRIKRKVEKIKHKNCKPKESNKTKPNPRNRLIE